MTPARRPWARQYPPLVVLAVAVALATFALPSALILPQASPTQTLEYAPVPNSNSAPPGGSFSGLGLGSTGTLGANGVGGLLPPPPPNQGGNPTNKDCVGNPPRQTEDPLSPPCVPYYAGNNGGATYQGVTGSEIRIVIWVSAGTYYSGSGCGGGVEPSPPAGTYVDLAQPIAPCEFFWNRFWKSWMIYFNSRYQTYDRYVHGWLYYGNGGGGTPAQITADAADNYSHVHPFAVIADAAGGSGDELYMQAMAQRGVIGQSMSQHPASFFAQYPGLLWSFSPSTDNMARQYADYLCRRMAGRPVDFSGPAYTGQKRVYGVIRTTDQSHPELIAMADQTIPLLQRCGISITDTATFPMAGYYGQTDTSGYSTTQMARFEKEGITTILWLGGLENNFTTAADNLKYFPEWMVEGDTYMEGDVSGQVAFDQAEWDHAWVLTAMPWLPELRQQYCYEAYKSVDPGNDDTDILNACAHYAIIRQLLDGIQVAGPHLTPQSMDEGYHAIPATASKDPQVPACYYSPGDYTCIKDVVAEWWDSTAQTPYGAGVSNGFGAASGGAGCYRAPWHGRRFSGPDWPDGNVTDGSTPTDPCTAYVAAVYAG